MEAAKNWSKVGTEIPENVLQDPLVEYKRACPSYRVHWKYFVYGFDACHYFRKARQFARLINRSNQELRSLSFAQNEHPDAPLPLDMLRQSQDGEDVDYVSYTDDVRMYTAASVEVTETPKKVWKPFLRKELKHLKYGADDIYTYRPSLFRGLTEQAQNRFYCGHCESGFCPHTMVPRLFAHHTCPLVTGGWVVSAQGGGAKGVKNPQDAESKDALFYYTRKGESRIPTDTENEDGVNERGVAPGLHTSLDLPYDASKFRRLAVSPPVPPVLSYRPSYYSKRLPNPLTPALDTFAKTATKKSKPDHSTDHTQGTVASPAAEGELWTDDRDPTDGKTPARHSSLLQRWVSPPETVAVDSEIDVEPSEVEQPSGLQQWTDEQHNGDRSDSQLRASRVDSFGTQPANAFTPASESQNVTQRWEDRGRGRTLHQSDPVTRDSRADSFAGEVVTVGDVGRDDQSVWQDGESVHSTDPITGDTLLDSFDGSDLNRLNAADRESAGGASDGMDLRVRSGQPTRSLARSGASSHSQTSSDSQQTQQAGGDDGLVTTDIVQLWFVGGYDAFKDDVGRYFRTPEHINRNT